MTSRTLRVLVVDDEPMLVTALLRTVVRAGHRGVGAYDGAQALDTIENDTDGFDVVVCDVRMPSMDGPTFLRRLRARGDRTPFVFLTGYGDYSDRELLALGATAVLGKPTSRDRLFALFRDLSDSSRPA
ncbi:MAG: response regulator [Sandaracinus sp.]|nr:response regulator [Sandaracinus sp.]MCB9616684.1 response regulator [Sandaracinus sp.]